MRVPQHEILQRTDYPTKVPILNYYNVHYIILYKEAILQADWPRYESLVHEILGRDSTPYYDDRLMQVYKVPIAPKPSNPFQH